MIAKAALILMVGALARAQDTTASLDRVAEVATAMVDGDLCRRIETDRSKKLRREKDPRDPWRGSDNFDVNDDAFIRTKKTLIRLARLCPQTCDVNLWTPLSADASRVQILIRNAHETSQFWNWGDLDQETPPEMKPVLREGKRAVVRKRPRMVSILAPVYDSLGDIAGLVEVVSQSAPDPRENVK